MLGNLLLWLGLLSFMCSMMVGLALLEQDSARGSPFLRNVMFAIGIAVVIYIFIMQLGEPETSQAGSVSSINTIFPVVSIVLGSVAGLILAFAAEGNKLAAVVAGGLAGITMFLLSKNYSSGNPGLIGSNDIRTAISILATMLVGGLTYYLLRHWGKSEQKWD
jgi:hypothetical protein